MLSRPVPLVHGMKTRPASTHSKQTDIPHKQNLLPPHCRLIGLQKWPTPYVHTHAAHCEETPLYSLLSRTPLNTQHIHQESQAFSNRLYRLDAAKPSAITHRSTIAHTKPPPLDQLLREKCKCFKAHAWQSMRMWAMITLFAIMIRVLKSQTNTALAAPTPFRLDITKDPFHRTLIWQRA